MAGGATQPTRGGRAQSRPYLSPQRKERAARTRAAVLLAATEAFDSRGWAGTGMRDIASAAGVSVETVYATFGSKAALLRAVLDVAVVGDDEPVVLADRTEFIALGLGDMRDRAAAAARLLSRINRRTSGIHKALCEAAATEPELEQALRETDERRRISVATGGELVAARRLSATERDGLWAITGAEVYRLLVERTGWSIHRYEQWIAETLIRLLTVEGGHRHRRSSDED